MRMAIVASLMLVGCSDPIPPPKPSEVAAAELAQKPTAEESQTRSVARAQGNELHVAETNLQPLPKSVNFALRGIWRYDPDSDRWKRVLKIAIPLKATIDPAPNARGAGAPSRRILELPERIGLYWVKWTENGSLVFNGPVRCNDIRIGDPPDGKIAACVPFAKSAKAKFVPDPKIHCK